MNIIRGLYGSKGITLVEALVSILILGITLVAMLGTFIMGRISATKAKYYIEAVNLLRAEMEEVRNTAYGSVVSGAAQSVSIDIGPDLARDTTDDLMGTIQVEVRDKNDLDGDNDTTETEIDIDGDAVNDPCKPVYVTISWTSPTWGGGDDVSEEVACCILFWERSH